MGQVTRILQHEQRIVRSTLCYDRPLTVGRPTYAGFRTLESMLLDLGPLAQALWAALAGVETPDPFTIPLNDLARQLTLTTDRNTRVTLWQVLEQLAALRLVNIDAPERHYSPPVVILDATVRMEMNGRVLRDVHTVTLLVNHWFLEPDRLP